MSDLGQHPLTVPVYDALRQRGTAPPQPREYGLRLVSEVLRAAEHHLLLQTTKDQT